MRPRSSPADCERGRDEWSSRGAAIPAAAPRPMFSASMQGTNRCRYTSVNERTRNWAPATAETHNARDKTRHGLKVCELLPLSAMSLALGLLVLTIGSLAVIARQLRRAPEAFENETGFHFSSTTGSRLSDSQGAPRGAGAIVRAALFQAPQTVSRRPGPDSLGTAGRPREAN